MRFVIILLIIIFAEVLVGAFETPIKYMDANNNTCACLVSGEKVPTKDQCKLVGKKFEKIEVQKCDN